MRFLFFLALVLIMAISYFLLKKQSLDTPTTSETITAKETALPPPEPLLGERMLANHALPETPPALDPKIVSDFVKAATMDNRHIDTFYFSTNPDLTEILLGKEGMSHPQISAEHPIIGKNKYGETSLLDRWGSAYRIHLKARDHIEIFSAGPDKFPGNTDDLRWPPAE